MLYEVITGAIAGLIGGMAGAACGASMDYGGAFEDRLWSGFTDLASIAATEGASYATHLAYSSYRGESGLGMLEDAWSHSSGLSLNVANAGSLLRAAGFVSAVSGCPVWREISEKRISYRRRTSDSAWLVSALRRQT